MGNCPMSNHQINALRLIIILSITLVFGVVLHHHVFKQPGSEKNLAVIAPVEMYALNNPEPAKPKDQISNDSRQNIAEKTQEQEGDAPILGNEQEIIQPTAAKDTQNFSARSIIVIDDKADRIIYQKNIDERMPMASITKLMTAVVASENLIPETLIKITKNAIREEGSAGNLNPDEEFTLSDLMKIMLITSSNDAAGAVEEYFTDFNIDLVVMMNQKAKDLEMNDTHFTNVTGLDQPDHFSTARDLAKLASYILNKNNTILDIIAQRQATVRSLNKKIPHFLLSTNQLLQNNTPEILGGKTGYTKNALGCMLSILKDGHIIVVLGSENRFGETEELIRITQHET